MKSSFTKLLSIIFAACLISACSSSHNSSNSKANSESKSTIASNSTSTSATQSSNNSSSKKSSPISSQSISITPPASSVDHNPNDCDNHVLVETILKKATLLEKGIKNYKCENCHADFNDYYYDMDEFVFEDETFMDDGQEHRITIDGVLPYGVTVQYENNTLKGVGNRIATAKFFNEEKKLILEKTATLHIVENIGVPSITIVTEDGVDPDRKSVNGEHIYKNMTLSVSNCESGYAKTNVTGEIKVRGNSTNQEAVAKRAFRIKMSSKMNFFGLNNGCKEKSWVLLADFFDQSMFRNECAFSMGDALFNYSGYYSSDYKHVNLYMNGTYRGIYLFAEQQQAKKERIPINEPSSESVIGTNVGYLLEIDGLVDQNGKNGLLEGDPCFKSASAGRVNSVSIASKGYVIKTDTFSDEQRAFAKKFIDNTTKAFADTCNGTLEVVDENADIQPSPYNNAYDTLNTFLDIDSFFRMYLLQEFVKDFDVGWGSFYMYFDFSANSTVKRLTFAAPWDFDLAEGNKNSGGFGGGNISAANDNFLNNKSYANGMTTANPWLYMLSQTNFFDEMFKKYYSIFDNSGIVEKMIDMVNYEKEAFKTDFDNTYTTVGLPNASGSTLMSTRQYSKHADAVAYLLNWFNTRKNYLDDTWKK